MTPDEMHAKPQRDEGMYAGRQLARIVPAGVKLNVGDYMLVVDGPDRGRIGKALSWRASDDGIGWQVTFAAQPWSADDEKQRAATEIDWEGTDVWNLVAGMRNAQSCDVAIGQLREWLSRESPQPKCSPPSFSCLACGVTTEDPLTFKERCPLRASHNWKSCPEGSVPT